MATTRTRTIFEFMLLRMLSSSLEMGLIVGMHFVRQVRLSPHRLLLKDHRHLLSPAAVGNITGSFQALHVTVQVATTRWACVVSRSMVAPWPGLLIASGHLPRSRAICP